MLLFFIFFSLPQRGLLREVSLEPRELLPADGYSYPHLTDGRQEMSPMQEIRRYPQIEISEMCRLYLVGNVGVQPVIRSQPRRWLAHIRQL